MATQAEVRNQALEKLGVIGAGETPDTVDSTTVDNAYASIYEELRSRHLVDWASGDDVPSWAVLHVVDILSNRVANRYGIPRSADEEAFAFAAMAKHLAVDYIPGTVKATYY